jgi:hypothetical protein
LWEKVCKVCDGKRGDWGCWGRGGRSRRQNVMTYTNPRPGGPAINGTAPRRDRAQVRPPPPHSHAPHARPKPSVSMTLSTLVHDQASKVLGLRRSRAAPSLKKGSKIGLSQVRAPKVRTAPDGSVAN